MQARAIPSANPAAPDARHCTRCCAKHTLVEATLGGSWALLRVMQRLSSKPFTGHAGLFEQTCMGYIGLFPQQQTCKVDNAEEPACGHEVEPVGLQLARALEHLRFPYLCYATTP